jgi:phage tail-like protein
MARNDPYSGFRFVVEIDGLLQAGFTKVRGLQRETKIDSYREGGVNDFERKLINLTTYPALVLDRGLADQRLWDWHQKVIEGQVTRRTLTVTMHDERGRDVWGWIVSSAFPSKWSVSDLDAASGQVSAESIEFVHHGILRRQLGSAAA